MFLQENNLNKYNCEKCNFTCSKKSNYNIHCSTQKHINNLNNSNLVLQYNNIFSCKCGKKYSYASGLSRHKSTCNLLSIEEKDNKNNTDENIILTLLKENNELKDLLLNHTSKVIELLKNNNSNP
jgi:hypothetical protein